MMHQADTPWTPTPLLQFYQTHRLVLCPNPTPLLYKTISYTVYAPSATNDFSAGLALRMAHSMVDTQARIPLNEELALEAGRDEGDFKGIWPFPSEFYQGPFCSGPSSQCPLKHIEQNGLSALYHIA